MPHGRATLDAALGGGWIGAAHQLRECRESAAWPRRVAATRGVDPASYRSQPRAICRQMLLESLLLSLMGAMAGLAEASGRTESWNMGSPPLRRILSWEQVCRSMGECSDSY